MKHLPAVVVDLRARSFRVLAELHPLLREKVEAVLRELEVFTPYCGYRGEVDQAKAKLDGRSNAAFGQSPHNFRPALACDLVLNPVLIDVRPHLAAPDYPDLWDDITPVCAAAWASLEVAAARHNLERVDLRGVRDKPHLQLEHWGNYLPTTRKNT